MADAKLDRLVKGAPPPDITISSVFPPKEPLNDSKRSSRASTIDPFSSLPSSPPQIYLNLLILETSLRSQYLILRARRRQYTFFLTLLFLWCTYFSYALFLRPREDGRGLGGSVYWVVEMGEKVALMAGIVTAILIWGTGQWDRGIRWPRRWLGVTNRGLRTMNAKVIIIKGPWWREILSHLSFLFPFGSSGASSYHYIDPDLHPSYYPIRNEKEKRLSSGGHHSHRSSVIISSASEEGLVEEDLSPGGDVLKLLLLPKPFSAEFRENWELYRNEYWEKENTRRAHLLKNINIRERASAKQRGGWLWWTGYRGRKNTQPSTPTTGTGPGTGTGSRRSLLTVSGSHSHRHRDRERELKRHSQASSTRTESHSRNSSRSTTPSMLEDDGNTRLADTGGRLLFGERNRRRSSVSERRGKKLRPGIPDTMRRATER